MDPIGRKEGRWGDPDLKPESPARDWPDRLCPAECPVDPECFLQASVLGKLTMTCSLHPPGDTCLLTGTFDASTQAAGWALRAGIAGGRCSKWERMGVCGGGWHFDPRPSPAGGGGRPHLCHRALGFASSLPPTPGLRCAMLSCLPPGGHRVGHLVVTSISPRLPGCPEQLHSGSAPP